MSEHSTQLAALQAVLDKDAQAELASAALDELLHAMTSDEIAALGTAAQQLSERCETAWYRSLAADPSPTARLLGKKRLW